MRAESVESRVEAWLAEDPDPKTRAEASSLAEQGDRAELEERFGRMLEFGTAGLRGEVGAGYARMNRLMVMKAAWALCTHLKNDLEDATSRGVCVGFDGRRDSARFAEDVAEVTAGLGISVRVFDRPVPTPVLAFASRRFGAAAGVMITASHNPPEYNGMKVYGSDGAQIVPPTDASIAALLAGAPPLDRVERLPREAAITKGLRSAMGETTVDAYLEAIAKLPPGRADGGRADVAIAYTAMHGVGEPFVRRALGAAGFHRVISVPEQAEPDPDFPTLPFPNPEEPGALDRALELARAHGCELMLANDPDADRLAVAVPRDDELVTLDGNAIGCLLAHYLLEHDPDPEGAAVVSTIVSSPRLGDIARYFGATWVETLTGHKWIHHAAIDLEATGKRFVFGYEEALGYAAGSAVRDKDGVSAALLFASLARWCAARGKTIVEELETMNARYGRWVSVQGSERHPGRAGRAIRSARMSAARTNPPDELNGSRVIARSDVLEGKRVTRDGGIETIDLPPSDLVIYELEGGHRVMLRPSGTEPKLKRYVNVRGDAEDDDAALLRLAEGIDASLVSHLDALSGPYA